MKNGRYVKSDEPVVLFSNGNGWRYLNDLSYSEEECKKYLLGKKLEKDLKYKNPSLRGIFYCYNEINNTLLERKLILSQMR